MPNRIVVKGQTLVLVRAVEVPSGGSSCALCALNDDLRACDSKEAQSCLAVDDGFWMPLKEIPKL
ncbi:hypothetical protein [Ralstonia phage RpT1]|nr:hypothetical protein [Ralstonia phage RpT1]